MQTATTMTDGPETVQRDYSLIPKDVLDAVYDLVKECSDNRVNGMAEISFAQGGVAKVYSTYRKIYK